MKRKVLFLFCASLMALAATSCQKEEFEVVDHSWKAQGDWSPRTFSASFSMSNEKTAMDNDYHMIWLEGDQIKISGNGQSAIYDIIEIDGSGYNASFSVANGSTEVTEGPYTATYPASFDGTTITLPAVQTYHATNRLVNFPMYAESENRTLNFHNMCGVLELNLRERGISVKQIIVSTDQNIAGNFSVGTEAGTNYKCVKSSDACGNNTKTVVLDCGGGVSINSATKFYIYLPVADFSQFSIEVVTTAGASSILKKTSTSAMTLERNHVKTVGFNKPLHNNPDNGLRGLYSVSASQRVFIAHGNLYYKLPCTRRTILGTRTDTVAYWGFYNKQWGHYHNSTQGNASGDTLSFFPWGYNNSTTYNYATNSPQEFVDWGSVASIKSTQVGNKTRGIGDHWRTLSGEEWHYLLFDRTMTFGAPRYAAVELTYVENNRTKTKNGILLYPDRYNPTEGPIKQNVPGQRNPNYDPTREVSTTNQALSTYGTWTPVSWSEWQTMEGLGCAFLPANGYRAGTNITTEASYEILDALYHTSSRRMDVDNFSRDIFGNTRSVGAVMGVKVPDNAQIGGNAFGCGHNVRLMMNEEYGPTEGSPIQ